jgi:hypothetical protein
LKKSKYGQLVLEVLGAVQKSTVNPLERDLLGALINVESTTEEGDAMTERPARQATAIANHEVKAIAAAKPAEVTPEPETETDPEPEIGADEEE